ncbi:MAG: 2-amino-4-hydroxy-6-hydroxymethyldihydropteridine diphosphokinase [Pseudomonadota bacterium]
MRRDHREPVIAYVGIGANLDDPVRMVQHAFDLLEDLPGCHVISRSSLYRSAPFGGIEQADFINAVAEVETGVPPEMLLSCLKETERNMGRDLDGPRWGPRELDLDILLYGSEIIEEPDLTVPHPGIALRNFVLLPLMEIAPDLDIPGLGPVSELEVDRSSPQITKIDNDLD